MPNSLAPWLLGFLASGRLSYGSSEQRRKTAKLEAKKPRSQVVSIAHGFRNAIKVHSKNAELLGSLASRLLGFAKRIFKGSGFLV